MIFLTIDKNTHDVHTVIFEVEHLSEETKQKGFMTDKPYPQPDSIPFKKAVVKYDPVLDEFSHTYEDRPLTPDEEAQQLKTEMKLMQTAIDDLIMGGMM